MKVLEEVMLVERAAWERADGAVRVAATLAPRRESAVYQGHFPGQPVTPGVCMVQAVVELLSQAVGRPLRLKRVVNVKYTAMMGPDDVQGATLAATLEAGGAVSASYTKGDTLYAKLRLDTE